ncbi:hypothetical protein NDU88_002483 [Pleurodeles waltl]|uniref:Uncharacterized protein n=1 Tax=Pleurodeles waltl TaxID=8319 RepID=A0AAV7WPN7_PLEWA|nr:hypothetical protein NDU88_002483 [Pleurodeles waltl]
MVVTSAAVTSAAVRIITASAPVYWLLGPIGHRQLGHIGRRRNPPVYRPLVDLLTMEERHVIVTYRFDRATIQELCTQLEPDLMSPICHPTGIPPDVQVLWVPILLTEEGVQHHHRLLHNLALRRQVPFLQEDDPDDGVVAVVEPVEPVDSDEDEADEDENDNRESVIQQYFQ